MLAVAVMIRKFAPHFMAESLCGILNTYVTKPKFLPVHNFQLCAV